MIGQPNEIEPCSGHGDTNLSGVPNPSVSLEPKLGMDMWVRCEPVHVGDGGTRVQFIGLLE